MSSITSGSDPNDDVATAKYLDMIRTMHREWSALEGDGDAGVQLSARARNTIREAVRADSRHGAHVEMPPTPAGPFTVSEASLRGVVRSAVDAVPGALALRTTAEHAVSAQGARTRGRPERLRVRISAALDTSDLPSLARRVRSSVAQACHDHLGLDDLPIDVHIEDLHEEERHEH